MIWIHGKNVITPFTAVHLSSNIPLTHRDTRRSHGKVTLTGDVISFLCTLTPVLLLLSHTSRERNRAAEKIIKKKKRVRGWKNREINSRRLPAVTWCHLCPLQSVSFTPLAPGWPHVSRWGPSLLNEAWGVYGGVGGVIIHHFLPLFCILK